MAYKNGPHTFNQSEQGGVSICLPIMLTVNFESFATYTSFESCVFRIWFWRKYWKNMYLFQFWVIKQLARANFTIPPSLPFLSQNCHDVVEREPYMRQCLSEVCSCTPHMQCQCTVLTAYAQHCAQEGMLVSWRNYTFCRKSLHHHLALPFWVWILNAIFRWCQNGQL